MLRHNVLLTNFVKSKTVLLTENEQENEEIINVGCAYVKDQLMSPVTNNPA